MIGTKEKSDQEVMNELRLFREFSYRDVGRAMGISHSRVQQLELGKNPLTEAMKTKFLNAICVSLDDWNLLKQGASNVSEVKLECIQRIYELNPAQLVRCVLLLRNFGLLMFNFLF
jgi:transcriptional regulator with XRE-family HTH domain